MDINIMKNHVLTATTVTHLLGVNKTSYSLDKYFFELKRNNEIFRNIFLKYENEAIGKNIQYGKLSTIAFDDIHNILKNYSLVDIHQFLYLLVPFGVGGVRINNVMTQIEKYMEKTLHTNNLSLNQLEGFNNTKLQNNSDQLNDKTYNNENEIKSLINIDIENKLPQFSNEIKSLTNIDINNNQLIEKLERKLFDVRTEMNDALRKEKCNVEHCNNIIKLERNNMTKILNDNIILNDKLKGSVFNMEILNKKILEKDAKIANYEDTLTQTNSEFDELQTKYTKNMYNLDNKLTLANGTINSYKEALILLNSKLLETNENNKKLITNLNDEIVNQKTDIENLNEKLLEANLNADIHKDLYFQYKQEFEKIKGIINK